MSSFDSVKFVGGVKFHNNKIRSVHIDRPFRLEWTDVPDLVVLAGKNGSGKSRLLQFLNDKFRQQQQQNSQSGSEVLHSIYRAADEPTDDLHKYTLEYERALARDFVDHLKRSKIYRSSFLNDAKEFIRSRDDNFFSMYFHRDLCKKIALEMVKVNSDPNDPNWRSDAIMAIDRFADQIEATASDESALRLADQVSHQPFSRPMNYLLSLVDEFNQRVASYLSRASVASSSSSSYGTTLRREDEEEALKLESQKAKLVLLFNNINSKLIKYNLPYKFDWVEHNDFRTELRFINTKSLVNQVVYAHFSTRRQNYRSFRSIINEFTVRDESSLAMDSSPLVFYGEFSTGEKMILDLIAWTSLIEENMINVGLILLDEPDAHLNSSNLETLINLIKGLFLNSALNSKSVQVIFTTNRIELVRLMRKHVSKDFWRVGLDLKLKKKRITNGGGEEIERVDERLVQPIKPDARIIGENSQRFSKASQLFGAKFTTYKLDETGLQLVDPTSYIDARSVDLDERGWTNLSRKVDDLAKKLESEDSLYTNEARDIKQTVDRLKKEAAEVPDQEKKRKKLIIYA